MKNGFRVLFSLLAAAIVLVLPIGASGQITVNSADVLALIGKSQTFEYDTTDNVTVNVGVAGANQTWDFRGVVLQAEQLTYQFVAPASTPYAAQFPTSNFVQQASFASMPGSMSYTYWLITADNVRTLGGVYVFSDTVYTDFSDVDDNAKLPLQFGMTWQTSVSDTFGDPSTFASISITSIQHSVDAWGTVRLPAGDFACLRIRENENRISQIILAGSIFSSDTTASINYLWISKNDFLVADATSQDDETNPNFTSASYFGRIATGSTGIEPHSNPASQPNDFVLQQNYPNPFNPETTIPFDLASPAHVELAIFNVTGERVRTLVSADFASGTHHVTWDGRDQYGNGLASGIYWYRLRIGGLEKSRTMLLVR